MRTLRFGLVCLVCAWWMFVVTMKVRETTRRQEVLEAEVVFLMESLVIHALVLSDLQAPVPSLDTWGGVWEGIIDPPTPEPQYKPQQQSGVDCEIPPETSWYGPV